MSMVNDSDAIVGVRGVALGVAESAERRDFGGDIGWCVRGRRIEGEPSQYEAVDEPEWIREADIEAVVRSLDWRAALDDRFDDLVATAIGDHQAQGMSAADTMRSEDEPLNPFTYDCLAYQQWEDAYQEACR